MDIEKIRKIIVDNKSAGEELKSDTLLVRTVKMNGVTEPPPQISQISYPPSHKATAGRCNLAGRPVFYCSNSMLHHLPESDCRAGDIIAVGFWQTKASHRIFDVSAIPELGSLFAGADAKYYELTAAITDFIFDLQSGVEAYVGVRYPSVLPECPDLNYAFKTDYVDQHMRLVRVDLLKVVKDTKPFQGMHLGHAWTTSGRDLVWDLDRANYKPWVVNGTNGKNTPLMFTVHEGIFHQINIEKMSITPECISKRF